MSVVVSDQEIAPSVRELTIEVPAPAVEAETLRVVQEYTRKVRLPGFRQGKAPVAVVRSRYRKEIDQEVLDRLLPRYWRQAEAEKSIEPLLAPRIQEVGVREGEPLVFKAVVEVRPAIEVSADRNFELPPADSHVTDQEVEEVIDHLRRESAPWATAAREAARGDRVKLRLLEKNARSAAEPAEGEPAPEGAVEIAAAAPEWQEATFEIGDQRIWEELSLAATGLRAGQRGSFSRQEPASPEAEAPQPRHFDLEITEVLERDLPELTDAVAQSFGDFTDEPDLRSKVRQGLERDKRRRRRSEREQAVVAQLIERHPVTVPERVVDHELREMLEDYAQNLARSGVDVAKVDLDWQEMSQQFRPGAQRRVQARLILDAVADADGIEVPEPVLEAVIHQMAHAQGKPPLQLRRWLDEHGRLSLLRRDLRRQRTIAHLLGEDPSPPEEVHPETHDADEVEP